MKKNEIIARLIKQIYMMTDAHENQIDKLIKEKQDLSNKIADLVSKKQLGFQIFSKWNK